MLDVALASIIVSLLLSAAAYMYVSVREDSYLNVLTPTFAVAIPTEYLLDIYHLWVYGPSNSNYAYILSYACYAAYTIAFAFGYTKVSMPALRLPFARYSSPRGRLPAYVTLSAAICLYLPVLIQFRSQLADPRAIYMETRTGYGVYFFLSSMLAYLALIFLLFAKRVGKIELSLFFVACAMFVWLQGSKGHLLGLVFIMALHWTYVRGRHLSLPTFLGFTIVMGALGIGLFLITTPTLITGGMDALSGYSDYSRNGMMVIDSGMGPFYGRLTLENQVYPRIPRALDPEKPRDFGDFYLAEHFFPDKFVMETGAPAFANGTWYADFGVLSLPLLLIAGFLSGLMLKMFMASLRRYRTPGDFILVLFASGVPLITLGATFLLPESILIAIVANGAYVIRLRGSRASVKAERRTQLQRSVPAGGLSTHT